MIENILTHKSIIKKDVNRHRCSACYVVSFEDGATFLNHKLKLSRKNESILKLLKLIKTKK